jgi:hypothetical protein
MLRDSGVLTPDGLVRVASSPRAEACPPEPFKLAQRLNQSTINEIITEYKNGKSSLVLASDFRISKGSVIRTLRDAGVSIRNRGLSNQRIIEAAQLYESGLSLAKIGAQLGIDHGTVRRHLLKRGIKMRDTHGRAR